MGGPTLNICENKGADQLRGNREADRCLCFRSTGGAIPPLSESENSGLQPFRDRTAWLVSDQVGSQNVVFLMARHKY